MDKEQKELEFLKEKLSYYKELLRNLTVLLVALAGGIASLLFRLTNPIASVLTFVGLVLLWSLMLEIIFTLKILKSTLKELEKWKEKP
jgi:hypothetical protein